MAAETFDLSGLEASITETNEEVVAAVPPVEEGNPFGEEAGGEEADAFGEAPAATASGAGTAALDADVFSEAPAANGGGSYAAPLDGPSEPAPAGDPSEEAVQARIREQAAEERESKTELREAAQAYLDKFYADRDALRASRIEAARKAAETKAEPVAELEGDDVWSRTLFLIDSSGKGLAPAGTDLSRFRSVLQAARKLKAQAA